MYHVAFDGRHTPTVLRAAAAVPVPLTGSDCGPDGALSATVKVALRVPDAAGENVTETVHDAPAASVLGLNGHVVVSAKSPAFAPLTATLEIANAADPEFVTVTDWAELVEPTSCEPKLKLVGDRPASGVDVVPVPLRVTFCGLPVASSAIVKLALRAPATEGENVTEMEHDAPAASVFGVSGHVVAREKSPAFAPLKPTLEMVRADEPEFVNATDCGELVEPTS
jgi:hypothetical protein